MHQQPSPVFTVVLYVVVLGLFVYRMVRPRKMSATRLLVLPVILLAISVLAVWGNAQSAQLTGAQPAPPLEVAAAMLVGVLAGIPLGMFRGRHSEIRPSGQPGVFFIHSSPLIIFVWIGVFAVRALLRYIMPHAGPMAEIVADGTLLFAMSALVVSYLVIYRRMQQGLISG